MPRSISTGRFQSKNTGIPWNMEAGFRPVSVGTHRKLTGIHRKNPDSFRGIPVFSCRILRDPVAGIFDLGVQTDHEQLFQILF
jgi:hypothetical protein